jgi:hypothetical protein
MVKFDFSDGVISIRTHYDHRDRCTAIPGGQWSPKDRAWKYLLTPATASSICQSFSKEISEEDRQKLQSIASRLIAAQDVKNGAVTLQVPVTQFPPWHHQLVTFNMVKQLFDLDNIESCGGGALAALDMGPQPLDSKILTPNGWTTMGEIKIGDLVIGKNGKPTKVIRVIPQGIKDVFEITFSDKAKTRCCDEHLWPVISPRDKWQNKKFRPFSLSKIKSFGLRNKGPKNDYWRWFIPMVDPIEYNQHKPLPFDPYLIGALIGDGGLTQGIYFTSADQEIIDEISGLLPSGIAVHKNTDQYGYYLGAGRGNKNNPLLNFIRTSNLNVKSECKHIPREYLMASIQNRVSLLQGLLDTDGCAKASTSCGIEFCTSSKQLGMDFQELVWSLGGTATMMIKKTSCLDAYRFYVKFPFNIKPFRLKRKADIYNNTSHATRSFRKIKHIGKMQVQCITVEAEDGLYVTDDFIVTHNCGKSKVSVDLIANFPHVFRKVLVVCPSSVIDVWTGNEDRKGQFEIHAVPEAYKNMLVHPVKNGSVEKKTNIAEAMRFNAMQAKKQFICVINYESAWREPFANWAMEVGFDLVILDECHRIKSPGGKASKYFAKLAKTVKYRLGLTGTPCPHSPLDAYGQYRFLDPGIFGTSFTKFRDNFCTMGGFQNHQVLNFKNQDMLHDKMFLIAHRVMSRDVFDLPKFQSEIRTCDLSSAELNIYREMDLNFCAELANGQVTADNAMVKLLRLQEITSGFLDGQPIGESKKKLLSDVFEDFELREPIIVFARFTNDLRAIQEVAEKQGRRYGELSGHANELSQWQIGNKDVLGVQIKSGREGVDFTRARYSIYYSLGFSLGDYEQSIKRLDRPGQLREGMYIHLLVKNSVDEKVMEALAKRKEVIESVLNQYRNINEPDVDDDVFCREHADCIPAAI